MVNRTEDVQVREILWLRVRQKSRTAKLSCTLSYRVVVPENARTRSLARKYQEENDREIIYIRVHIDFDSNINILNVFCL